MAGAWQQQLAAIERSLTDLDSRRARLLLALETTDDASGALAHDVNRRLTQISQEQAVKRTELQLIRQAPPEEEDCEHLLDHLFQATAHELSQAPEAMLRRLFEACGLTVHYDPHNHLVTCEATVTDAAVPIINQAAVAISGPPAVTDGWGCWQRARRDSNPQPSDP